jgi:colanic acid/amylovoran biosynthesis glycosyltransferase
MNKAEENSRLIYVMTHYPKLAQTFIQTEITTLREEGIEIIPIALNPPELYELKHHGAAELSSTTRYLKSHLWASLGSLIIATFIRPLDMAKVWGAAVASAGGHPARMIRRIAHLAHAAQVERIARMLGVRHIHAHFGLAPATIGWFASAIAKTKGRDLRFSFTIHGFHDFADPSETRLDLKVPAATAVICVSDFTRSQLFLSAAPTDWKKCHVVRCGLELSEFSYRDPTPLPPHPLMVSLGRLSPEKGTAVLIDALALLLEKGVHPPRLRIIGDGPERAALEAMANQRGLVEFVTFLGELSPTEVRAELTAADIFSMASFSEGLPVSLMEAMAVGTPCVTTWIAGIPELAEDGVTALAVPPARADRLANAIARMLSDEELRLRLARGARRRIEAQHDAKKLAKLLKKIILEERPQ